MEFTESFNVILVKPLPNNLKCLLCSKLLRNPLQTIRGKLACEPCYTWRVGSSGICPIDGEPILPNEYFKDRCRYHQIQKLECCCYFKEKGCLWRGKVAELEDHSKTCRYHHGLFPGPADKKDYSRDQDIQRMSAVMDSMQKRISELDKNLSELNLKQQLYENCSYNGKMVWKVDNLNSRMQQAVIGRVTALHSAPCFTEKNGYRFCGQLYLNGDGLGKCTHVSVFFVLMKSEYDNLLQWPFTKRVKFRLINQDDPSRSIEESFIPDRFSSSFQRPVRDMNVAAGCPMFVSKEDLFSNGFVEDDAILMEITVEDRMSQPVLQKKKEKQPTENP